MSVFDNRALVRRYFEEIWNDGNVGLLDELTGPGYRRHVNGCPAPLDRQRHKERLIQIHHALPDVEMVVEHMIAADEYVVSRVTLHGTQQDTFLGIPPTGRRVAVTGIDISRIVDGRIAEQWAELDTLSMIQQLGGMPASLMAAAR